MPRPQQAEQTSPPVRAILPPPYLPARPRHLNQYKFKQDLAQVYFEGYDQEVARRLLAREIHGNAELMAELEATGYRRSQKRLSPKQVGIIEKYLG